MNTIKLRSRDAAIIIVDRKVAEFMLKGSNPLKEGQEVYYIPSVNSKILKKIITWTKHHIKQVDQPQSDDYDEDDGKSFDKKFLDKQDMGTWFELIRAAKDLGIKELLDTTSNPLAKMWEGKTFEEVWQELQTSEEP